MANDIQTNALTQISSAMNDIQSMWNLPQQHIQAINKSATLINSRHGLLSGVPIICKDTECPYHDTCMVDPANRIVGSRCPQEIGALLARFEALCEEFKITEEDAVDLGQVKELVDLEMMMLRCDNKMAKDASFIERTVKDVLKNGRVLYEDQISQAVQLKLQLIEKHSKILKDLNGTRSSKKERNVLLDPSQQAAILIQKAKEIDLTIANMPIEVQDADYVEVDDNEIPGVETTETEEVEVVEEEFITPES